MNMAVLGDSVAWGQGLLPAEKFSTLVCLARNGADTDLSGLAMLAHSGAIIGVNATITQEAIDPEVPDSYPTIIQQCASFSGDTANIDVVIVNGGINDVGVTTILNPFTDASDLADKITQHCHADMRILLEEVIGRFSNPHTKIVVPCYFPILSEASDPFLLSSFLALHGLDVTVGATMLGDIALGKIFDQCRMFFNLSSICLGNAVSEANVAGQSSGGPIIKLCKIPFLPENAALAPQAWLWGINPDLSPEDPVSAQRHRACDQDETDPLRCQTCYRASMGHPNITGAKQYATGVLAALGP